MKKNRRKQANVFEQHQRAVKRMVDRMPDPIRAMFEAPDPPARAELPGIIGEPHVDTPNGAEDEGPFLIEYPESAERGRPGR